MLKGVQRRMVEVKLSGSKAYESACFILRRGAEAEARGERELVDEAKRIVDTLDQTKRKSGKKALRTVLLCILLFLLGALIGFSLSLLLLG